MDVRREKGNGKYTDLNSFVRATQDKEKILPSQVYVRQALEDGDIYTYRARPDIHAIAVRLIYPNI